MHNCETERVPLWIARRRRLRFKKWQEHKEAFKTSNTTQNRLIVALLALNSFESNVNPKNLATLSELFSKLYFSTPINICNKHNLSKPKKQLFPKSVAKMLLKQQKNSENIWIVRLEQFHSANLVPWIFFSMQLSFNTGKNLISLKLQQLLL